MSILDADMVPAEDFLQLSLPLFFAFDPAAEPRAALTEAGAEARAETGARQRGSAGAWVCPWEVAMVASPQHYRNLESNGSEDDPLNQKNEAYTRYFCLLVAYREHK